MRAAAASDIPLISAVGHETDTTLIDFASDCRAPTPTAAAEMAVPVRAEIAAKVIDDSRRMVAAMERIWEQRRVHLTGLARGLPEPARLLEQANQRLDAVTDRLPGAMERFVARRGERIAALAGQLPHPRAAMAQAEKDIAGCARQLRACMTAFLRHESQRLAGLDSGVRLGNAMARSLADGTARLDGLGKLLESLSYRRVLERGFALVRDAAGQPLVSAAGAGPGAAIEIELSDGALSATVTGAAPAPGAKPKPPARKPAPKPKGGDEPQGTLL